MAGENGDARVTLATLDAQVKAIDRDYQDLRRAVIALDTKIDTSTTALSNRFEAAVTSLVNKIDQRSTTPWQAIFGGMGVFATIIIAIGTALYLPIQRDTLRLDTAVAAVTDRAVFQRQYDADQTRLSDSIKQLRGDYNGNIQQQRYNADQEKLTHTLEDITRKIELLRVRSYDNFGQLKAVENRAVNLDARLDAISRRLAEFIRDMGKR